MADADTPAPVAPDATPDNTPEAPETTETGGVTPEEVASTLRSSGINLPAEPVAAAEDEEGDDPDAPAADSEPEAPADEEAEPETTPEAPAADETKEVPSTTADPDKYSLTVEDANGVTYKIPVDAKMEDILGGDFELKNNGQALDILDQLGELRAQKKADEAEEAEKTAASEQAQRVLDIRKGWDSEVTDLKAQNRLADGEAGDTRVSEVYKFMNEENDKRIAAGKTILGSFEDALDKLEAREARDKAVADAKEAKNEARRNGSLVGGSSAPATASDKVYVAGSARNSGEAIRKMNLL